MSLELAKRIEAFSRLGSVMKEACTNSPADSHASKLRGLAAKQYLSNPWFTPDYVEKSISALAASLNEASLLSWLNPYPLESLNRNPKHVAVIMAGNIPLVGFHDFLSVLITGNIIIVKSSSKDKELIEQISDILREIEPSFKDQIITEEKVDSAEAVIATGSNNTSRYFEYSYGHLPHIFRKNRNSVAILDAGISDEELRELGKDVFYYYGLGCRNVSRLYLHQDFDIKRLSSAWKEYASHMQTIPYQKNYIYNRALYKMEELEYHDLDYLLLKKDQAYSSPVSVLNYSYYNTTEELEAELAFNHDKIQVITGRGHTPFGKAQYPALNDYADGVDTINFLRNLS